MNKGCLILVMILSLVSCSSLSTPRKYTYSNQSIDSSSNTKMAINFLDVNAFYIYSIGQSVFAETNYHILKFSAEGQVQWINLEAHPSIDRIKKSQSDTHYYKIDNGILKMEVYVNPMVGFDYWEGKIYEDSIVFFKINRRREQLVYKKMQ